MKTYSLLASGIILFFVLSSVDFSTAQFIPDYDSAFIGNPLPDPVMQHNKETYVLYGCAYCHGMHLKPVGEAADLRKSAIVGTDVNANLIGPILRVGIPQTPKSSPMPQFSDLSDQEIRAITSYIHYTRAQENYKVLLSSSEKNGSVAAGKIFFEKNCIACHSVDKGFSEVTNKFNDQELREQILQPSRFRTSLSFKLDQLNDADLNTGRAKHQGLLENYMEKDFADVVAYLQTLK